MTGPHTVPEGCCIVCSVAEKKDLVRVETSGGALDPYEAQYMGEQGSALLHAKTRTNWQAPALTGAAALFVLGWCATHSSLGLGLGLGGFLVLLGLFFSVLRVKVTTEHVDVHYGIIGPKIPIGSIESVESITHGYNSFGRWGVSPVGRGEWLYAVAGDQDRAVKITWRNGRGRRLVHYIGTPEPEELAAAIESACNSTRALPEGES